MSETISVVDSAGAEPPGLSIGTEGILARVRYRPAGFNPVEARIAAAVLEDPARVCRESIVSFAQRISVSTGSVVRFAKLLGLAGFHDLKLAIVAETAPDHLQFHETVATSRFRAIMDEQVRAIALATEEIDPTSLDAAAFLLSRAGRVDIAATGASTAIAQSLLFSLTLFGVHVRLLGDSSEQGAAAAFLGEGDCLVAISVSGLTRPIVDAASRASQSGATVIAMTCNPRSSLVKHASLKLIMDGQKGRFTSEAPLRTALVAVSRALMSYVAQHLPVDELNQRRSKWSSGRFGLRYGA
jgi:DNA-binding MurR/RpiR family transcriptional regulator